MIDKKKVQESAAILHLFNKNSQAFYGFCLENSDRLFAFSDLVVIILERDGKEHSHHRSKNRRTHHIWSVFYAVFGEIINDLTRNH